MIGLHDHTERYSGTTVVDGPHGRRRVRGDDALTMVTGTTSRPSTRVEQRAAQHRGLPGRAA